MRGRIEYIRAFLILKRLDEFLNVLEGPVHRSETHVGDVVKFAQLAHEFLPDQRRIQFFFAAGERPVRDSFDDRLELRQAHRALLAGGLQTLENLFFREGLAPSVFFHDERKTQRKGFDRRKARLALQAFAPATNDFAFFLFAGIKNPVFAVSAVGAFHDERLAPGITVGSRACGVNQKGPGEIDLRGISR